MSRGYPARLHLAKLARLLWPTLVLLGGCAARVGPKNLAADRFDYSSALTRSAKEQMLLNMVKLRYMDPPVFLNVQQVIQQYTRAGTGSIAAPGWTGDSSIAPSALASGTWAESPTITYSPLSGEKFTKSLLKPVSPLDVFSVVESGWPIDAVFEVTVRAINGLHAGSRTDLLRRSGDPDFYHVLSLLRELQASDSFDIRIDQTQGIVNGIIVFRAHEVNETNASAARDVRKLLHLDPDAQEFRLAFGSLPQNDKEIVMLTRSMMEILAEAAAGVEIPSSDVKEGRVSNVAAPRNSSEIGPTFLVRVRSSTSKPREDDVFTAVPYRNHWFWVDDRDLPSKRELGFLMMLFTLVETETTVTPPVLTISKP